MSLEHTGTITFDSDAELKVANMGSLSQIFIGHREPFLAGCNNFVTSTKISLLSTSRINLIPPPLIIPEKIQLQYVQRNIPSVAIIIGVDQNGFPVNTFRSRRKILFGSSATISL